jgi:hypothetical protein
MKKKTPVAAARIRPPTLRWRGYSGGGDGGEDGDEIEIKIKMEMKMEMETEEGNLNSVCKRWREAIA